MSDTCNLVKAKNESTILKILPSNDKESSDQQDPQDPQDDSFEQSEFMDSPEEKKLTCLLERRSRDALNKVNPDDSNHYSSPSVGLQKEIEEEIMDIRQTAEKYKAAIDLRSNHEEDKVECLGAIDNLSYPKSSSTGIVDTASAEPLKPVENVRRLSAVSEDVSLKDKENNKFFSKLKGVNWLNSKAEGQNKPQSYIKSDKKENSYPQGYFSKLAGRGGGYFYQKKTSATNWDVTLATSKTRSSK